MIRSASRASLRPGNARISSNRYPVTINPLLRFDPLPEGFHDLDEVLDDLIDDTVERRLSKTRQKLSSALCPERRGLKFLRLSHGLSQKQLSDAVGTSQPRLSVWENNPNSISMDSIRALTRILDVDYNTFFEMVFDE